MRFDLTDTQFEQIHALFPTKTETRGRKPIDHRQVINGIFYVLRTGVPWRDLPDRYGTWQRVYTQFRRWNQQGLWQQIHLALAKEADLEMCFVDSTTVVVHQQGLGAKGGKHFRK
jgi:transposase